MLSSMAETRTTGALYGENALVGGTLRSRATFLNDFVAEEWQ